MSDRPKENPDYEEPPPPNTPDGVPEWEEGDATV